jgi:hypothetical protein
VTAAVAAALVIVGFGGGVGTGWALSHGDHGERGGYGAMVRPNLEGRPGGEYVGPGGPWAGPGGAGRYRWQGRMRAGAQQQNPQQQNPQQPGSQVPSSPQPQSSQTPSSTPASPSTAENG